MSSLYANNAVGTLSIAVGSIDTILQLSPGHGDGFPTVGADEWFYVTLVDETTGATEICRVTARDGDSLTVVRGVDATIARPWEAGTVLEMRLVAQILRELQAAVVPDSYLLRAGGTMFGAVNWRASDVATNGFTQRGLTDGALLLDSADPNSTVYLYPSALNGTGSVIAYRLQYSSPVTTITVTARDLVSGAVGVASHFIEYDNVADGTLRLVAATGNTAWVRGNWFSVFQRNTGRPTVTAGPGVTILCPANYIPAPRDRYSTISFQALSPTLWVASGDLAEAP